MTRGMTNGMAVTPQWLREISAQLSSGAADVEAIVARLSGDVAPVRSEWVGAAQAQFNFLWDHMQRDAEGIQSVLTSFATLTKNAAVAYEATEASIIKSFDEFRVERDLAHAVAGVFDEARQRDNVVEGRNSTTEVPTEGSFASGSVPTDTVTEAHLTEAHLTEADVTAAEVTKGEVTPAELTVPTVTPAELTAPTVTAAEVTAPTVTKGKAAKAAVTKGDVIEAEVTEAGENLNEEAASSEGRAKGAFRPPWARFTTKAVQDPEAGVGTGTARVRERRFKATDPNLKPGTRLCRLCFTVVVIEPQYIEKTDMHVYLSCPHCERSFPIRHSDV